MRGVHRRHHPDQQRRDKRDTECNGHHAPIRQHRRDSVRREKERANDQTAPLRDTEADGATDESEYRGFRRDLSHQASSARAEREAQRELATPREGARE